MTESSQNNILEALNKQIQEICDHFKLIRNEALEIINNSQMPDATLHLNDVLKTTEEATTKILNSATAISSIADAQAISPEGKAQISEHVGYIYEACGFQDISGQQIQKVLRHLNALEAKLSRLSDTAKGNVVEPKASDPLLNGPQLSSNTISQEEVDRLFASY